MHKGYAFPFPISCKGFLPLAFPLVHWKGFMAVSLQLHWPSGSILGIGGTLHLPGRSHRAVKPQRKRRQAVSVPCSYNVVKQIRVVLSYTEETEGANFWGVFCSIV